ncbi:MAG: NAD(P)/FAD-dependent oxidoreductase [Chitinophagaceae bacterium]|nr:NAD(P)/FAD-dependent oxidoreductase [Chitinophagaceae bacterium]
MEEKIKLRPRLVVIGGGAAGFFCAVNAARLNPSLEVFIIERTSKLLSKVRVSGGGRCNVTHACYDSDEMIRRYPRGSRFLRKSFHHFFTTDTIEWFATRGVELKTEADGRMFPASNNSQSIIDCLLREANQHRVQILMNKEVKQIVATGSQFSLKFANGIEMMADYVCLACGGFPKESQFEWIKNLGHTIEAPVPSLFTFNMPQHPINQLMGVSVEHTTVKIQQTKLQESGPLLITHWGMSGPVILKLSAWGARELSASDYLFNISVNWLPEFNEQSLAVQFATLRFELASQKLAVKNPFGLPARLWEYLLIHSSISNEIRWADLNIRDQNKLIRNCCAFEAKVQGKTTFKEEFVTAGGVRLQEINHDSMMSKKLPNLYFAGEIMDVDGITGGYNFQHAWTSGFIAAAAIAKDASNKLGEL